MVRGHENMYKPAARELVPLLVGVKCLFDALETTAETDGERASGITPAVLKIYTTVKYNI